MAKQLEKKHTLAVRWLHWVNFPLLAMMIWSGLLIYWAWSNILTIFQQYIIMHRLKAENPIDTFIERMKKAKA